MASEAAFLSIFHNGTMFKPALENHILSSTFDSLKIVSAVWKFFLVIAPELHSSDIAHPHEWTALIRRKRSQFSDIKSTFLIPAPEDAPTHPLDRSANSEWTLYFKNEELKTVIQRDIDRLYQTVPFFQDRVVLKAVHDIVFLQLKQFPGYGYQQGFHELCGVVYWLYRREMRVMNADGSPFQLLFDASQVDADVFWSYSAILKLIEPYYRPPDDDEPSFLSTRCDEIQKVILSNYAPELASVLMEQGVYAVQYMVPWLRVMFARLYSLEDSVKIWTRFFAFAPSLALLEGLVVGILLAFKEKILTAASAVEIFHIVMHADPPPLADVLDRAVAHAREGRASRASRFESVCSEIERVIAREDWFEMPIDDITTAITVFRDALLSVASVVNIEEIRETVDQAQGEASQPEKELEITRREAELPRAGRGSKSRESILIREVQVAPPPDDLFARPAPSKLFE
jgi:hypothetical protein